MHDALRPSTLDQRVSLSSAEELAGRLPRQYAGSRRQRIVRRTTRAQGMVLEILGHAIEYLEDSNFHAQRAGEPALAEALALLRQSSRAVFAESAEAVPAIPRLVHWLQARLHVANSAAITAEAGGHLILFKR